MTDVYDWRGHRLDEPDSREDDIWRAGYRQGLAEGAAEHERLRKECDAHESALTMVEEENARLVLASEIDGRALAQLHEDFNATRDYLAEVYDGRELVEAELVRVKVAASALIDAVMAKHVILSGPPELLAEIDRALDATLPLVQEES